MKYTNEPLVSIGLPVYNGEKWVKQAIESLVTQTYSNIEIMIGTLVVNQTLVPKFRW